MKTDPSTRIWIIEVRSRQDLRRRGRISKTWSATARRWYGTRQEAKSAIRTDILPAIARWHEYRVRKYGPSV